jgi:hypothetical protein
LQNNKPKVKIHPKLKEVFFMKKITVLMLSLFIISIMAGCSVPNTKIHSMTSINNQKIYVGQSAEQIQKLLGDPDYVNSSAHVASSTGGVIMLSQDARQAHINNPTISWWYGNYVLVLKDGKLINIVWYEIPPYKKP